jgi:hypothetical protein
MPIFLFGCLDIGNLDFILRLNAKCCLDGQREELQLYEILINYYIVLYMYVLYTTSEYINYVSNKN